MVTNDWTEWKRKQEKERKISDWTKRFEQAKKNQPEWIKVHAAYLKSDIWSEIRDQVIIVAKSKCESCGSNHGILNVHHKTYERIGGNEKLEDLQVLCFSCHQKADRIRNIKTDERRKYSRYLARLNGYASTKYGDDWSINYDEEIIEIEFVKHLYKPYCGRNDIPYDPNFDTDTDMDFLDFWNDVLDGNQ